MKIRGCVLRVIPSGLQSSLLHGALHDAEAIAVLTPRQAGPGNSPVSLPLPAPARNLPPREILISI